MPRPKQYPYIRSQWDVIEDSIYTYGGEKIATVKTMVNIFSGEVVKEVIDDEKENRSPISYPP